MKNKLEVGMYVRTKDGKIGKYLGEKAYEINKVCIWTETTKEGIKVTPIIDKNTISKTSHNIIDILEVGDMVNSLIVTKISEDNETQKKYINLYGSLCEWENEDIKSIVTHEQMEQMSYRIGDKE